MSDNFKSECRRRCSPPHPAMEQAIVTRQEPLGAGSGGDPGDGGNTHYYDGDYVIGAAQMHLYSGGATGENAQSPTIALLAGDMEGSPDGTVVAHGSQGVRITSGPPKMPKAYNTAINGVEIQVGTAQEIIVRRGAPAEQTIQISPGLMVVSSPTQISIESDVQIELTVAGGTSSIMMTPAGIVIKGPIIQIN
jgi:hypothetical protein